MRCRQIELFAVVAVAGGGFIVQLIACIVSFVVLFSLRYDTSCLKRGQDDFELYALRAGGITLQRLGLLLPFSFLSAYTYFASRIVASVF
jgi:hypothetical protein